jgi:Ni/Fe-hydrogenase 1 B-type cytochrome subunit
MTSTEGELATPDLGAIAGDAHGERAIGRPTVYVYEAPVRICHWVNALSIFALMITGYLIASPLPSVGGEASDHFGMGYIRFVHFAAGQILAVFFLARIFWAFVGNHHSRQIFYIPVRKRFWKEVLHEIRWYAFLERDPKMYVGHNPLAGLNPRTSDLVFIATFEGISYEELIGRILTEAIGRSRRLSRRAPATVRVRDMAAGA